MKTTILIAGEGGQGIQTIAKIISDIASQSKFNICYIPSFGVEQRGTPSIAYITISDSDIFYPKFERADYIIVLQKRAVPHIQRFIDKSTKVIFDSSTILFSDIKNTENILGIPATKIAYENSFPRSFNVIIAGKLSHMLNFTEDISWSVVEKVLGKKFKNSAIRESNHQALLMGRSYEFETKNFSKPTYQPAKGKIISKGFDKTSQILPELCKGCGICITKCPVGALRFSETLGVFATPVPEIDLEKCISCGNCLRFCPDGAIMVVKDKKLT